MHSRAVTEVSVRITLNGDEVISRGPMQGEVRVDVHDDCYCERLTLDQRYAFRYRVRPDFDQWLTGVTLAEGMAWKKGEQYRFPFNLSAPGFPASYAGKLVSLEWLLSTSLSLWGDQMPRHEQLPFRLLLREDAGVAVVPMTRPDRRALLAPVKPFGPVVSLVVALMGLTGSVYAFVHGSWIVGTLCALPGLLGALLFPVAVGDWRSRRKIGNVQIDFPATPCRDSVDRSEKVCEVWTLPDAPIKSVGLRFVAIEHASTQQMGNDSPSKTYRENVLSTEVALERASPGVYRGPLPMSVLARAPRTMQSLGWRAIARIVVDGCPYDTSVPIRVLPAQGAGSENDARPDDAGQVGMGQR